MISIIIPIKDNLEYTIKTLDSIAANTSIEHEIIVIDNASKVETVNFLSERNVHVIRNEENLGCAKAWNQGIKASKGRYICMLNNDVEVPQNWLSKLVEIYNNSDVSMLSPAIKEGEFNYDLDSFNEEQLDKLNGILFADEINGVAMFSEKALFDKVGLFDENFLIGKYEDEDMFWRIKKAGLKTAITSEVFIHHYGSKTVTAMKKQLKNDFELKNRNYFLCKWKQIYLLRKLRKLKLKFRHKNILKKYGITYTP